MKFLILGLPRSRTAWLANFLTYGDLFCHHEGVNGCSTIDEYIKKTNGVGDSNTGLMFFDYQKYFPDVKTIVIDSDPENSIQFGREVYGADCEAEMIEAKKRLDNTKGLHIKLEDINDRLQDIWEYVSDEPFNEKRADMLVKMNVQVLDPHDLDKQAMRNFKENVSGYFTQATLH